MLPTKGHFKDNVCPYYDLTDSYHCARPYCHYKHSKKALQEHVNVSTILGAANVQPTTTATILPKPKQPVALPCLTPNVIAKRKITLEYQPEKPSFDASPSKPRKIATPPPAYVPSNTAVTVNCNNLEEFSIEAALRNIDECEQDLNELSDLIGEQSLSNKEEVDDCIVIKQETELIEISDDDDDVIEIKQEKIDTSIVKLEQIAEKLIKKEKIPEAVEKIDIKKEKDIKIETRHRHSKDKEHSRHKHKSSSSDSHHKSSREKSKHRSESKDKHEHSRSKDKEKVKSTSKKIESKGDVKRSHKNEASVKTEDFDMRGANGRNMIEEETCLSIFQEIEAKIASELKETRTEKSSEKTLKRKTNDINDDDVDDAEELNASNKKRVAYENADKVRIAPPKSQRPNHVRNAMQSVFQRQEEIRKIKAKETEAAEQALKEAEEKVRLANEELKKIKEQSEQNLTPLIPTSYLTPPPQRNRSAIFPCSSAIALERAKKKVEELKAAKQSAFTPAQSAKGSRVAHKPVAVVTPAAKTKVSTVDKPPVLEPTSSKISFNLRMQYYDMMVKHCLAMYPNEADAWERAQTEELSVFKKCTSSVIYKSSSMLTINKLKKEAIASGNKPITSNNIVSHEVILAGKLANNTSWSVKDKSKTDVTSGGSDPFDRLSSEMAYALVYELRLNEDQLLLNGYPRLGQRPGTAIIKSLKPIRRPAGLTLRYCSRCGREFNIAMYDEDCVDECNYHPKSTGYRRGYADNQHRCCQQPAGTPGCSYANYHVTDFMDFDNLNGFVSTIDKYDGYIPTKKDIYAIDCEMCYTTAGIELTRVTVVDINARTVYDALVKPENKIVDYNTIYSGITEKMLQNETRTLRDVQAILTSMFHSKTILVGHSLESDLKALKLIHNVVVDTSILFPHKMGPPKKRALKTLCIENLKRIIQENVNGHDSAEDAEVCIQLIKFYLRNKIS